MCCYFTQYNGVPAYFAYSSDRGQRVHVSTASDSTLMAASYPHAFGALPSLF